MKEARARKTLPRPSSKHNTSPIKSAYKVPRRADADYAIAKEKCDDAAGNTKDVCKKDAKAAHVRALENAKVASAQAKPADNMSEKRADVAEAKQDAAHEKKDADYKAAKERCDTLKGAEQDTCVADAKHKFGM